MSDFHSAISFSRSTSERRIQKASELFGAKIINNIIAIALFLLGGNREQVSNFVRLPTGTLFSLLTRFHNVGLNSLVDQRVKGEVILCPTIKRVDSAVDLHLSFGEQTTSCSFLPQQHSLSIRGSNPLQFKTILLSLMNSGIATAKDVSEQLGISARHARELGRKLEEGDIEALLDKRQGQKKNYVFTGDIQTELIKQCVANIVTGRSTASSSITRQVNEACNSSLSERTVRLHMARLGMNEMKNSLLKQIDTFKKNSEP